MKLCPEGHKHGLRCHRVHGCRCGSCLNANDDYKARKAGFAEADAAMVFTDQQLAIALRVLDSLGGVWPVGNQSNVA